MTAAAVVATLGSCSPQPGQHAGRWAPRFIPCRRPTSGRTSKRNGTSPPRNSQSRLGKRFAIAAEHGQFREDEEPVALIETGLALVAKYVAEGTPSIQPQAVELPVGGVIAGVRVQGIVDLLDIEGRIIDCKTAVRARAPSCPSARRLLFYRFPTRWCTPATGPPD